jgi:hypothetical protein
MSIKSSWLWTELNLNYGINENIGKAWIYEQQLILLLDGLHELDSENNEHCVQAINQFLESEYKPKYLVLCNRLAEHELSYTKPNLIGAIYTRLIWGAIIGISIGWLIWYNSNQLTLEDFGFGLWYGIVGGLIFWDNTACRFHSTFCFTCYFTLVWIYSQKLCSVFECYDKTVLNTKSWQAVSICP